MLALPAIVLWLSTGSEFADLLVWCKGVIHSNIVVASQLCCQSAKKVVPHEMRWHWLVSPQGLGFQLVPLFDVPQDEIMDVPPSSAQVCIAKLSLVLMYSASYAYQLKWYINIFILCQVNAMLAADLLDSSGTGALGVFDVKNALKDGSVLYLYNAELQQSIVRMASSSIQRGEVSTQHQSSPCIVQTMSNVPCLRHLACRYCWHVSSGCGWGQGCF